MLASQLFFSEHAYRKRVKWPVEYAIGAVQAVVSSRVPMADLTDPLAKMGQVLFNPPNVKGWRTGTDWLNSATLLARNNFAEHVAMGEWTKQGVARPRNNRFMSFAEPTTPKGPTTSSTPPPPPANQDPIAPIYASKPKDVAAVVKAMGELVYGQDISKDQAAKLVKFLNEPGPPPGQSQPQQPQPKGPPRPGEKVDTVEKVETIPSKIEEPPSKVEEPPGKVEDPPAKAPNPKAAPQSKKDDPKTRKDEPKKPYKPDLASDDFKARVREALHAMMCLPEYQLN